LDLPTFGYEQSEEWLSPQFSDVSIQLSRRVTDNVGSDRMWRPGSNGGVRFRYAGRDVGRIRRLRSWTGDLGNSHIRRQPPDQRSLDARGLASAAPVALVQSWLLV